MATQIQLRRGTAAQWVAVNPVLAQGEPGFESDTGKLKLGDGVQPWAQLDYLKGDPGPASWGAIAGSMAAQVDLVAALGEKANAGDVGLAGGIAPLGSDGKVPTAYLPVADNNTPALDMIIALGGE